MLPKKLNLCISSPILWWLMIVGLSLMSCSHQPQIIPKDKEEFIGTWRSHAGFIMDINSNGTADLTQTGDPNDPDFARLMIGITPEYSRNMRLEFRGDSILIIVNPTVRGREYHIDRLPYRDGDTLKMVLNGATLLRD